MRLQALTAGLSQAVTSEQVANTILAQGMAVLGANAGCVTLLGDETDELVVLCSAGAAPDVAWTRKQFPLTAPVPLAEAVRERKPIILETFAERSDRYPALAGVAVPVDNGALLALPMVVQDRPIGSLGWGWPTDRCFTAEDRAFLLTLAVLCGQALDRARLYDQERIARERAERAEKALEESEGRFARFMQHLPGLAWIKDVQGRYVYANDAAVDAFGTPRAQLYGKSDGEVFPPATAAQFRENDQKALVSGTGVQVIETLKHDDGILHYSLVSKFPIPGPAETVVLVGGMAIDITEHMRTKGILEESEQRFRQLAENIDDVFWMSDATKAQVQYVSPAYERVWGRSCQSLYEEPLSFLEAIHPEDREHVRVASLARQSRGEAGDVEYRVVRPDGSVRWVRDRSFPVRDGSGRLYRVAGIAEDITERKRYEQSLKDADRRKDEFLATLAHELRNPLAPLRNGLYLIKLTAGKAEAVEQARRMMERQLAQMVRLIDDLLDVSRITRGKLQLRRERVELASIVQAAVEGSRPLIDASGHALTITLPPEPIALDADPARLAQVFGNLLTNAAKYTDRGGRIWLTATRKDGGVVVSVKDTGIGISAEHLPQLFQMFSQVDRSLERSQGGLGIGLTLVKRLVEMHGGQVEARSEGPGKGAEFVVHLPVVVPAPEPALPGREREPTTVNASLRILIVDDNRDGADSLGEMLRTRGNEVRIAYDGLEALDVAAEFRPDVVLLDIGLPKLNGYEACRRLREQPGGERMVIIAQTGWGQDEHRQRTQEVGFDHHLVKPVDPVPLMRLLAAVHAHTAGTGGR